MKVSNFYDYYELVNRYYYSNETRDKTFLPKDKIKPRICIFCGKNEHETTFKKEAHIIPAALGNRTLFTKIECDNCNQKSGDTIENDFSEYLNAIRVMGRKRSRKKNHITYKPGGKTSFMCSEITSNIIEIREDEEDEHLKVFYDEPNNRVKIEITPSRPINYVRIAKTLAKMGLLLLTLEDIKANYHIIKWINGEIYYLPTFYRCFSPVNLPNTTLSIFKLKTGITEYEPFFISLYFSNISLFLFLPSKDYKLLKRSVFPVTINPIDYTILDITPIECTEDKPKLRKETFYIEYERKEGPKIIENETT